jgi:hypothetical protein
MPKLAILDPTGHTEVLWRPEDATETEVARQTFEELTCVRKFAAFDTTTEPATVLKEFNPQAEEILLVPQFVGG